MSQKLHFAFAPLIFLAALATTPFFAAAQPQQPQDLALCSQCMSPRIVSKSGFGTAHAVAVAKIPREEAQAYCENWQPGNVDSCLKAQLASDEMKQTYHAAANCPAGKITAIDGNSYTLAGVWADDIGKGRTKWRDASAQVVGQDNASNGLAISQQWETLCPGFPKPVAAAARTASYHAGSTGSTRLVSETPSICNGQPRCMEVPEFSAVITDFRTSVSGYDHILSTSIRFQNKTSHPLILGYVSGSGVAIDEQGNRYAAYDPNVRGIGLIASRNVDTKFTLQPGEASDARFEFGWRPTRGAVYGLAYEMDLTVREVEPLEGNQLRLGAEHVIHFSNLGRGGSSAPLGAGTSVATRVGAVPSATPTPAASLPDSTAVTPAVDACAGRPRCYSAGPFVAEVAQLTASQQPRQNRVLHFNVNFRNVSDRPIILAYVPGSNKAIDNEGNQFYWGRAGTHDTSVTGMGAVSSGSINTSFIIRPGESRGATFSVFHPADRSIIGTSFSWNVTLNQVEVLPNGQQVRTVREYNLNFPDLTARNGFGVNNPAGAQSLNDAAKKLGGLFHKH
jgi:hypothetical protein